MTRQETYSKYSLVGATLPKVVLVPKDPLISKSQRLYVELDRFIEAGRREATASGFLTEPQSALECAAMLHGLGSFSQELSKAFAASFDGTRESVLRGAQIETIKLAVQGLLGALTGATAGKRIRNSELSSVVDAAVSTQAQLAQFIINSNMATAEYLVQLGAGQDDPDDDPDPAAQALEGGLRLVSPDSTILNQQLAADQDAA